MKLIKQQIVFGLKQKITAFTFYILLAIVLKNFIFNVFEFHGLDVIEMYQPVKLLSLSYNRMYYNADTILLLVQLYPILVVCPAGFMLLAEKNRKENILLITRVGSKKYYLSKVIAAFCVTAIVFTVPFFIELLLNCISFPLAAIGDFMGLNQYDPAYVEMIENYLFSAIYEWNPYLYTIIGILFFGIFSGILGAFTVAVSAILNIRYKIFLFLPVYLLLNATQYFKAIFENHVVKPPYLIKWNDYVFLFEDSSKENIYFGGFILILLIVTIACIRFKSRGDQL